jgi:hypothetical protein
MNAQAQDAELFPTDGETPVPDSSEFVATCFAELKGQLSGKALGTPIVSESERWGTVL